MNINRNIIFFLLSKILLKSIVKTFYLNDIGEINNNVRKCNFS